MKTTLRASLLTLALFCHSLPAPAQERVLTPEKAAGFDAVISQCVSFVRDKFANGMCDKLAASVEKLAKTNGLKHLHLGRAEWGFGKDEYLSPPDDTGFASPVRLTFYIRATNKPVSAFVWLSLYVPAADGATRRGRLVLWEDSGIGAGDTKTITRGLTGGLARKLEPVFQVLGEAKAK